MMERNLIKSYWNLTILALIWVLGCKTPTEQLPTEITEKPPFQCDECPILEAGADTLEYVNEVRRFLAKNADTGLIENQLCNSYAEFYMEEFPVQQYLEIFKNDLGTASCGHLAKMMVVILLENGIDAYTYSFGFEEKELAHEVVLFKLNNTLYISDPYLNYTPLTEVGEPLDIFSLIAMVGSQRVKINVVDEEIAADLLIDERLLNDGIVRMIERCKDLMSSKTYVRDSVFKIEFERCFSCDKTSCFSFTSRFESELKNRTDFTQFHEGYVIKTTELWGAADYLEMDDLIQTALYSQPNLGRRIKGKLK